MLAGSFLDWPIYKLPRKEKRTQLSLALTELTQKHFADCEPYRRILISLGIDCTGPFEVEDLPFLPVQLFKHRLLSSVSESQKYKVLTSSGTTGQIPSRIILDRLTATRQTIALARIMQEVVGKCRLPMLIIDHPRVIKDRASFSARGAGLIGLSNLGRDHVYALRDDMTLDFEAIQGFCEKNSGQPKLSFGFTFMIWQYLVRNLLAEKKRLDLAGTIMLHSGGWKKLQDQAVDNQSFKSTVQNVCGEMKIHNFYGMVEQVGSVFVECSQGHLHAPAFADVLVRDFHDWSVLGPGKEGLLQVLSCLPVSYPGHSLLTEDRGVMLGEDDCPCGWLGRYFHVLGRLPRAEIRGCGDTQPGGQHG